MRGVMNEILWHNPLAGMYGPRFLVFYAGFALVLLLGCRWLIRRSDSSLTLGPRSPEAINPYALAYLRGRLPEVVRLAKLSLIRRGFLEVVKRITTRKQTYILAETPMHSDPGELPPLERAVFDTLAECGSGIGQVCRRPPDRRGTTLCGLRITPARGAAHPRS